MCGRLNVHDNEAVQRLMEQLGLPLFPERPPRYNITPTSLLDVVVDPETVASMEWGIEFGKFRHPNTKAETIRRKPYLQKLLKEHRCVVPANRFYEWPDPKARPKYKDIKTRFCIHTPENVMFLGGIWKVNPDGVPQVNVLTTDPNDAINDFHHRMPVMLNPNQVMDWLTDGDIQKLYVMMAPYTDELVIYPCSPYVNNGRHEGPECMAPLEESA